MAYTLSQLTSLYNALNNRIQGMPTNDDIDTLTDLINTYQTAVLELIEAMTERLQALEDWKLVHIQDSDAHDV